MSKYAKELPQDPEARKAVLNEVDKVRCLSLWKNSRNNR